MIELKNVTKYYTKIIGIKEVNYTFENNKVYFVIGEKGSGKSTLLRILSKIESEFDGEILINEENLKNLEMKNCNISYMDSIPVFLENKTARENLEYVFSVANNKTRESEKYEKIDKAIKLFNLETFQNMKVKKLDLYQKRVLNFARILVKQSSLILIDEPFENLYGQKFLAIAQALKCLMSNLSSTIVIATTVPIWGLFNDVQFLNMHFGTLFSINPKMKTENLYDNIYMYYFSHSTKKFDEFLKNCSQKVVVKFLNNKFLIADENDKLLCEKNVFEVWNKSYVPCENIFEAYKVDDYIFDYGSGYRLF